MQQNYTPEELEVVKELEREMFKFNPGFRAMWHDDFDEYFKGVLDTDYWEKREEERMKELEGSRSRRMIEDPEYRDRMHTMALIEAEISGELDPMATLSFRLKGGPLADIEDIEDFEMDREWENDPLQQQASDWLMEIMKTIAPLYEQSKNIHLCRILTNAPVVPGKIVFASGSPTEYGPEDIGWRTDRVGYHLALLSVNRCLESFDKLDNSVSSQLPLAKWIRQAKDIRQSLVDRLENIINSSSATNK